MRLRAQTVDMYLTAQVGYISTVPSLVLAATVSGRSVHMYPTLLRYAGLSVSGALDVL